ncbi:MAG: phosphoenolpyruvate carboxykinase [Candidatus Izemoplasmatales bacterium]
MAVIKPFHMTDKSIVINLSLSVCDTELKILESDGVLQVFRKYLASIDDSSRDELLLIKRLLKDERQLVDIYKLLFTFPYQDILKNTEEIRDVLTQREAFYRFTEELYDFWRHFERYGIIQKKLRSLDQDNESLIEVTEILTKKILALYRKVTKNISGKAIHVYRQTPAGLNAGLIVSKHPWKMPSIYQGLEGIDVIDTVMLRTPFIGHSVMNTRSGVFQESKEFPLLHLHLTARHWLCYPVKVGSLLAYVYFHRSYLSHGVALSNLFEPALYKEIQHRSPNLVYVYGDTIETYDNTYYHDEEHDIYVGYVSRNPKNDYFGYMKKMLLTLHNVWMIDHGRLPIHGAMVEIQMKSGTKKCVTIIGDSGAGKSETLEALRFLAKDRIKSLSTVYDDMGVFQLENGKISSVGTEIGAFIRLDDLENGYAYKEIDRAFFLNPERTNARVILPVSTYETIMRAHPVDICLYANNYDDQSPSIRRFDGVEDALSVFREGKRKAKGTTSEMGIVTSFFANPFGCVQRQKDTEVLLQSMFTSLFQEGTYVGELRTKLAVTGKEHEGVLAAAQSLLELIDEGDDL